MKSRARMHFLLLLLKWTDFVRDFVTLTVMFLFHFLWLGPSPIFTELNFLRHRTYSLRQQTHVWEMGSNAIRHAVSSFSGSCRLLIQISNWHCVGKYWYITALAVRRSTAAVHNAFVFATRWAENIFMRRHDSLCGAMWFLHHVVLCICVIYVSPCGLCRFVWLHVAFFVALCGATRCCCNDVVDCVRSNKMDNQIIKWNWRARTRDVQVRNKSQDSRQQPVVGGTRRSRWLSNCRALDGVMLEVVLSHPLPTAPPLKKNNNSVEALEWEDPRKSMAVCQSPGLLCGGLVPKTGVVGVAVLSCSTSGRHEILAIQRGDDEGTSVNENFWALHSFFLYSLDFWAKN